MDVLEDLLPSSRAYRQAGQILFAPEVQIHGQPLTPLHAGHVGPIRNVAAKCKLTTRADRLGVKVTYVCQTSETGINIRILLAALRRFYDYLISSSGYEHANPLLQEQM